MKTAIIIGAGLTGSTIARVLAENGIMCHVFEARKFPGGLAADVFADSSSINVSLYGPHIFHTSLKVASDFILRFCRLNCYEHRVKSLTKIGYLDWPINLNTICKIFKTKTVSLAKKHWQEDIYLMRERYSLPKTFEQKAKCNVGKIVYDILMKEYSKCQWGKFYNLLPLELFKRIRVVDSFDDRFFDDKVQGIPVDGYTFLTRDILDHPNIFVEYNVYISFDNLLHFPDKYDIVVSTAPPDQMMDYEFGGLKYQKVSFYNLAGFGGQDFYNDNGDRVGVINLARSNSAFTRIANYRQLADSDIGNDIVIAEKPGLGVAAFPVRTQKDIELANRYIEHLRKLGIIQAGRLGLFEYINMDEAIFRAMNLAKSLLKKGVL